MADMFSKSYNQVKKDWEKIGKLYVSPEVVEKGNGFDSCLGFYDPGKKVMVKRRNLSVENLEKSEREYSILEDCEKHENILNWITLDKNDEFSYMSEERWSFTLEKLVNYFRSTKTTTKLPCPKPLEQYIINTGMNLGKDIDALMLKLMEDVAKGLNHLHEMGFFHRDLNPQNVVIVCGRKSMTAKIANFCTTERISINRRRSKVTTINHYTTGFQPPEQIKNNNLRKIDGVGITPETLKVDLFSFGCVIFYSLTLGEHPFGAPHGSIPQVCESYICRNQLALHHCKTEEAKVLVAKLLHHTPSARITITSALHDPLFWSFEKKLAFFKDVSEIMEKQEATGQMLESFLEVERQNVIGTATSWGTLIDPQLVTYITDPTNPNRIDPNRLMHANVRRLVRLIRNHHSHFIQLPANIQALYRGTVQGLEEYYRETFPRLLMTVYSVVIMHKNVVGSEFGEYITKYYA
ncbi:unnamed protein product [Arabidopsis arenosa]|uniref:Uncharacterized protein n=1 Tax=Arabidopsis arenosa TaxID=38785 RepID=A0A8S1ZWX7_ARAAE|nr:unnamed protein product [Arabidopsis arenosa]